VFKHYKLFIHVSSSIIGLLFYLAKPTGGGPEAAKFLSKKPSL